MAVDGDQAALTNGHFVLYGAVDHYGAVSGSVGHQKPGNR